MAGGAGDDVYYVDSLDDVVTELEGSSANGVDTAYVSVANYSRTKLANVENIILVGDGSVLEDLPPPENHAPTAPQQSGGSVNETAPTDSVVALACCDRCGRRR